MEVLGDLGVAEAGGDGGEDLAFALGGRVEPTGLR